MPLRPLPFVVGWTLVVLAILRGFAWLWDTHPFTGNLLVQIRVPRELFALGPSHLLWLGGGLVGLALLAFAHWPGRSRDPTARPSRWIGATMTFYPGVFVLGLFLLVFGSIYLFDTTVDFDQAAGGYATFVAFNYANLFERWAQSLWGLAIVVVALVTIMRAFGGRVRTVPAPAPSFTPVERGSPPAPTRT